MRQFLQRDSLLTSVLTLLVFIGWAASSRAENPLEEKLNKSITLDKGIDRNSRLKDVLEFFTDRYDLPLRLDEGAFKKQLKIDQVGDQPVRLPQLSGVRLGLVLDLLAKQVGGGYEIKNDHVEIAPPSREKKTNPPKSSEEWVRASKRTRERLEKPIALDKGIDRNTPLKDALEFLLDRFDVSILVDIAAFPKGDKEVRIEDTPVGLAPQNEVKLAEVLKLLLKQVGASYEIIDGAIIVAPPKKGESI
jgi:hypothetical protein